MGKDRYKVSNWSKYNEGLKQRGSIQLWVSEEAVKAWHHQSKIKSRGRQKKYSDLAIETCLTVRKVFHLALRQCEGFLKSLFQSLSINLSVPDYSVISRRSGKLSLKVPVRSLSGNIDIVVDSTGLKVYGEGEWVQKKYGLSKQRTWMKLHLAVDASTQQISCCRLTDNSIDDAQVTAELVDETEKQASINRFYGDGAYDKRKVRKLLTSKGISQIIPPHSKAVKSSKARDQLYQQERDQAIELIQQLGKEKWKEITGYHKRSLCETTMYRYKTIIGSKLQARKSDNQDSEVAISCNILNRMLQIAKPVSFNTQKTV